MKKISHGDTGTRRWSRNRSSIDFETERIDGGIRVPMIIQGKVIVELKFPGRVIAAHKSSPLHSY